MSNQVSNQMSNHYIDIQKAVQLTGKSLPTLRRLAQKAKNKQKKYIDGKLHFLDSFLFEVYPPIETSNQVSNHSDNPAPEGHQGYPRSVDELLAEKDNHILSLRDQLHSKDTVIQNLSERLRESNINLQTLQQSIKALPTHQGVMKHHILTDKLLYGVAIAAIVVLFLFVLAMIYAFFTSK